MTNAENLEKIWHSVLQIELPQLIINIKRFIKTDAVLQRWKYILLRGGGDKPENLAEKNLWLKNVKISITRGN
jgi:hypothetical protein